MDGVRANPHSEAFELLQVFWNDPALVIASSME
jgi:hypothetical protein